jgi:hypothetical protein
VDDGKLSFSTPELLTDSTPVLRDLFWFIFYPTSQPNDDCSVWRSGFNMVHSFELFHGICMKQTLHLYELRTIE